MVEPPEDGRDDFRAGPNLCVKYIVTVNILCTGEIIHVSEWYPGRWPDVTCLKHSPLFGMLETGEALLGDLAFVGTGGHVLHKIKRHPRARLTQDQYFYNYVISSFRAIVERSLNRLSVFQCLQQRWRHGLDLHREMFQLLCRIINIDLQNRPLAVYLR